MQLWFSERHTQGERITGEVLAYIVYAKEKGCSMTGPEDMEIERLNVLCEG
jgi:arginine/lysine/ornithine decarboxylase